MMNWKLVYVRSEDGVVEDCGRVHPASLRSVLLSVLVDEELVAPAVDDLSRPGARVHAFCGGTLLLASVE